MNNSEAGALPIVEVEGSWAYKGIRSIPSRWPMIVTDEVAKLSADYGRPVQRTFDVQADEYIYSYRFNKVIDRRAEVVFAIEDAAGQFWVHAKSHYPARIYRLPSGGVHWDESVVDGLLREVNEETGFPVEIVRFLGIIEYHFWYDGAMVPFASYVFHLRTECVDCPVTQADEQISEFRAVLPYQIGHLAGGLRNLIGDRRSWGQWRALAHDLVYETLLH